MPRADAHRPLPVPAGARSRPPAPAARRVRDALAALLIVLVAGGLLLETARYDLLGVDTYPLIIASRVQSWADLAGTFTEPLMDGRYAGAFYRPLLNASLALDYALWGVRSAGYQFSNVFCFAGCAAALYLLVRRIAGTGAALAPLAALAFFLLHPTHVEVLPVPARRPELLSAALMALTLFAQLSPRRLRSARPPLWPAVLTLLALTAKETAIVLPALVFVAVLMCAPVPTLRQRARHAGLAVLPHIGAVIVYGVARFMVLSGLGGHGTTGAAETPAGGGAQLVRLADLLFFPQAVMHATVAPRLLGVLLAVGLTATAVVALFRVPRARAPATPDRHPLRLLVLACAWLIAVAATYVAAERIQPWYLLILVVGWALLLGALVEAAWGVARRGGALRRGVAGVTTALLGVLLIWQAAYSPLLCEYDEWSRATAAQRSFLADLSAQITAAAPGTTIVAPPVPLRVMPTDGRPQVAGAFLLDDYSIQAWAELHFPARDIRVFKGPQAPPEPPAAGELRVLLTRRADIPRRE